MKNNHSFRRAWAWGTAFFLALTLLFTSCAQNATKDPNAQTSPSGPSSDTPSVSPDTSVTELPTPVTDWCSHPHTEGVAKVNATCTTDGYENRLKCTDCGVILENTGKIIPAYGHQYKDRKCTYCEKAEPSLVVSGQYENSQVVWKLYDDGELAVSGIGVIPDFPADEESYFSGYNKAVHSIVVYNGITSIGDNAFRILKDAETISISSSVRHIGDHAFDGWSLKTLNLSYGIETVGKDNFTHNRLFFLEIPASVRTIGSGSFASEQLITMRVPSSVVQFEVNENQFSNLTHIVFMGSREQAQQLSLYRHLLTDMGYATLNIRYQYTDKASKMPYCTKRGQVSGDFTYSIYTDNTARITKYRGVSAEVNVPEKIGSYTVVGIDKECFKENKNIRKVTLPSTCKDIFLNAFLDSSLEELTLLADTVRVGEAAFSGCSSFKTLHFEGVFTDVGGKAFSNTKVEDIPLSPELRVVRISAFAYSGVKNVNFRQFEIISESAFGRTSLGVVDLTGVQEVGMGAFYNAGVRSLNVTDVGILCHAAFLSNSALTKNEVIGLETVGTVENQVFDFKIG